MVSSFCEAIMLWKEEAKRERERKKAHGRRGRCAVAVTSALRPLHVAPGRSHPDRTSSGYPAATNAVLPLAAEA